MVNVLVPRRKNSAEESHSNGVPKFHQNFQQRDEEMIGKQDQPKKTSHWTSAVYWDVPMRTCMARRQYELKLRHVQEMRARYHRIQELMILSRMFQDMQGNGRAIFEDDEMEEEADWFDEMDWDSDDDFEDEADYFKRKVDKALWTDHRERKGPRNILNEFPDLHMYRIHQEKRTVHLKMYPISKARNVLSEELQAFCLGLIERNMSRMYQISDGWEWDPEKKREQLVHPTSRTIVAYDKSQENRPVGFACFRFEYEDGAPSLYLYELQIVPEFQGKGLGAFLIKLLERVARFWRMDWLMLTCFKCNQRGRQFYERLGFSLDETSPENSAHEILSIQLYKDDDEEQNQDQQHQPAAASESSDSGSDVEK